MSGKQVSLFGPGSYNLNTGSWWTRASEEQKEGPVKWLYLEATVRKG